MRILKGITARRYNRGKLRYDLVPREPLRDLAEVYTLGAHKYTIYRDRAGNLIKGSEIPYEESGDLEVVESGENNWRKGLSWSETIAAVKRHIDAFEAREDIDPDLKTKHLANAGWGIFSLLYYGTNFIQGDDRPHAWLTKRRIGLDIDGVLANFSGHLLELVGASEHTPRHWNDPIIRAGFDKIKGDKDFWLSIPPLIHGDELHFEPACYITARSIGAEISKQWLDKYGFPTAPVYALGTGESKVAVAKEANLDLFIDDSYENFQELNKAGINTYLFSASYNRKYDVGSKRIEKLSDINA